MYMINVIDKRDESVKTVVRNRDEVIQIFGSVFAEYHPDSDAPDVIKSLPVGGNVGIDSKKKILIVTRIS